MCSLNKHKYICTRLSSGQDPLLQCEEAIGQKVVAYVEIQDKDE